VRGCARAQDGEGLSRLHAARRGWPALALALLVPAVPAAARPLESADYYRMRAVTSVRLSADGARAAYTVQVNDGPRRPTTQLWIVSLPAGTPVRVGGSSGTGSDPTWSPDGRWLAFSGEAGGQASLMIASADGGSPRALAQMTGTNSPLTFEGNAIAWSPDGKRIAFVSATPGPETEMASGDPVVITRHLYRPDAVEGNTRLSDNRRRHLFVVDAAGGPARALTSGTFEEHSIDWSPDGSEILCVSNREPDPDLFYNPDLFAVRVADGSLRRLTATESAEFEPRWSPDGRSVVFLSTRRGLTDLETAMEDTHVSVMSADGSGRRELGAAIDNRQGSAGWAPDGRSVFFIVQDHGQQRLVRVPLDGGGPETIPTEAGRVESWSAAGNGTLAFVHAGVGDLGELYVRGPGDASGAGGAARKITDLNADVLRGVELGKVEPFTFVSNDFKFEVEAFLTHPIGRRADSRHPMVVLIHGGPHGAQGPAFNFKAQRYASRGWATLFVNYRGSTSYGQRFADAVFRDQNGDEGQDVLYGVSAALRRNPWIDRDRLGIEGGSYGGQLTTWLITQTHIFKAAIPLAPIVNNVSYNYMTYYNMYEEMEWGARPHQGNLMDVLWERSSLKHVARVKTPTMLVHGENDNDVPIAESEQFYIALKDVGVPCVLVRYPREGHGLREPRHIVDLMDRSIRWYERYFAPAPAAVTPSAP
jgi:dipeptidyl aminopeptidase/acylaminoacyl peptidase